MRSFYERNFFLIRRLHSFLGIIPVGAFFLIHMLLNSRAFQSPEQYQWVPETLDEIPFLIIIEILFILVPLVFHGALGLVIFYTGDPTSYQPPLNWYENLAYTLQRWTGVVLVVMLAVHLYQTWWHKQILEFSGREGEFQIFTLMERLVANPVWLVLYALFVLIAAYHFANGIFNFCYKWGITTNKVAQKWAIVFGLLVGAVGAFLGFASLVGLRMHAPPPGM